MVSPSTQHVSVFARTICLVMLLGFPATRDAVASDDGAPSPKTGIRVSLPVHADEVTLLPALPRERRGLDIEGDAAFPVVHRKTNGGSLHVLLTEEPLWIVEPPRKDARTLPAETSPFGFHPASVRGQGYDLARDMGVVWDRGGFYFFWILAEPELGRGYRWDRYDAYFRDLPEGMRPMKNITAVPDGAIRIPGRGGPPARPHRPGFDASKYVEGTSYRPSDEKAYSAWVRAAVERYDGDGVDDMPGLKTPAKHWQVDNEPPRHRDGYPDLVRVTSKAIKQADPDARVLMGGLQLPCGEESKVRNYHRTQAPLLRALEGRHIDIVDYHWFGHAGEWRQLPGAMKIVREDLERFGFHDTPIWFTEMGTYSGRPSPRRRTGAMPFQSERVQASEMVKRYTVALSLGVKKIFWAWGLKEGFQDVRDNDFFDNTGFVYDGIGLFDDGDGVRKLVFHTHRKTATLLRTWDGAPPERIAAKPGIHAFRFRYAGDPDRGIVVAWASE